MSDFDSSVRLRLSADKDGSGYLPGGGVNPIISRAKIEEVLGAGFYNAFEYAAVGMAVVDLNGRCRAANHVLCSMLQCDSSELLGEGFQRFTHPDDIAGNIQLGLQLISGQIPFFQYEKRYLRKDGHPIWVLLNASLVRDLDGAPFCVISQLQDIDHLKQTEAALRESEERYRGIVEDQSELICRFHIDGTLTFVNDAYCRFFNQARDELVGSNLALQLPESQAIELMVHFEQLAATGGFSRGENQSFAADGSIRWLEWTNRVLRDEQGTVTGIQSVGRDITERKLAETAELEQRRLSEALRDSAAALNSTLDFEGVLDRILANVDRVVPHDASSVMLIDNLTYEAYIVRQRGYSERGLSEWIKQQRMRIDDHPDFIHMIETSLPLVISDVKNHPTWVTWDGSSWIRSYAAAPITIKGQTIGFLNFDSATPGFFNEGHVKRLHVFADQTAVAIENARLFDASRHKEALLTRLYEAGMALASANTMATLYELIVQWACDLVNVKLSGLTLYDGNSHLIVVAAIGFGAEIIGSRIALGEGLSGKVAQWHKPLQTRDYANLEGQIPFYLNRGLTSIAAMPLIWQDRLIGTISVGDTARVTFDSDDMHMLGLYASLIASAIDQRRALAELEAREAEAQALSVRVLHAQEKERQRIASQLHDTIGSKLVELQKNTESLLTSLGSNQPNTYRMRMEANGQVAESTLLNSLELLRETQSLTQTLSIDLSARALAELGLSATTRQYIERLNHNSNCPINLHVAGTVKRLPTNVETIAYRGLQESVINALQHADATKINIRLHFGVKQLRLSIEDNGRGFDNESNRGAPKGTMLGLPELRRQVESLQGEFSLNSAPGQGTRIEIALPFEALPQQRASIKTRVVLVDPQEVMRNGLRMLLTQNGEFACVSEASDGLQGIHLVELHRPDIVMMDINLPYLSGQEVLHQISIRMPHLKVLILATEGNEVLMQSVFNAGARGFLLKTDSGKEILKGLQLVRDGGVCISSSLMDAWHRVEANAAFDDPLKALSIREREVLELIVAGSTNRTTGLRLGISFRTVEVHRKKIMSKLGVKSLAQLLQLVNGKLDRISAGLSEPVTPSN